MIECSVCIIDAKTVTEQQAWRGGWWFAMKDECKISYARCGRGADWKIISKCHLKLCNRLPVRIASRPPLSAAVHLLRLADLLLASAGWAVRWVKVHSSPFNPRQRHSSPIPAISPTAVHAYTSRIPFCLWRLSVWWFDNVPRFSFQSAWVGESKALLHSEVSAHRRALGAKPKQQWTKQNQKKNQRHQTTIWPRFGCEITLQNLPPTHPTSELFPATPNAVCRIDAIDENVSYISVCRRSSISGSETLLLYSDFPLSVLTHFHSLSHLIIIVIIRTATITPNWLRLRWRSVI